ncbi:MAG: hypothetical protein GX362_01480 [Methanosarcinaceae archaeon]|nr:hypothetical protein [Methanosarcinaceae archaeon]
MTEKNENSKESTPITSRDIALFESGIKLGALYHQFTGTPVSIDSAESIERAIEKSISLQPFVKSVSVFLDRKLIKEKSDENSFGYTEITGKMINAEIKLAYESVLVTVSIGFDEETSYPLMKVNSVENLFSEM